MLLMTSTKVLRKKMIALLKNLQSELGSSETIRQTPESKY
jgi:hypothetical protein